MRLLPKSPEHGWAPYTWLAYFGFFYIDPILNHAGWKVWLLTALGTVIFLALYFGVFWLRGVPQWIDLGLLVVVGTIYAPYNSGASTFFIFAAALLPFVAQKESLSLILLGIIASIVALDCRIFHLPWWFLLYAGGLSVVIGGSNIYFAQRNRMFSKLRIANQEIEHLAKVAERERIARDLHDVLGHTLSIIILKSELAGKLIDRDPERAKAEIRDVEQTSRTALAEVRNTIRGYHANSLEAELKQARATLETAGVTVQAQASPVPLTPSQESVIALVVREAVTNIVRHANARNCSLHLAGVNGTCHLEIHDDGQGGAHLEGSGLRGMRERVEALGGTLKRDTNPGTRLTIEFPINRSCDL